jgi:hypothetical protein
MRAESGGGGAMRVEGGGGGVMRAESGGGGAMRVEGGGGGADKSVDDSGAPEGRGGRKRGTLGGGGGVLGSPVTPWLPRSQSASTVERAAQTAVSNTRPGAKRRPVTCPAPSKGAKV